MATQITYGNFKYNCKTLNNYEVRYINRKSDEKIIEHWKYLFVDYFDCKDLEDEIAIKLGRLMEEESTKDGIKPSIMNSLNQLSELLEGTVSGERINLYYKVFEPLKFRKMKINKILNG